MPVPNRRLGFSLAVLSVLQKLCSPSLREGQNETQAVGERLWLEPQKAAATVHLHGLSARPADKQQPRESEDRSMFLTGQRQGWGKTPELPTYNPALPLQLALSYPCHSPETETVNRYMLLTYTGESLAVPG